MIETKATCKACKFFHRERGPEDDGTFIERVRGIAQTHSDEKKHEVEFVRHDHRPRVITPREFPPGPGLRENIHAINPLNDSYV